MDMFWEVLIIRWQVQAHTVGGGVVGRIGKPFGFNNTTAPDEPAAT